MLSEHAVDLPNIEEKPVKPAKMDPLQNPLIIVQCKIWTRKVFGHTDEDFYLHLNTEH